MGHWLLPYVDIYCTFARRHIRFQENIGHLRQTILVIFEDLSRFENFEQLGSFHLASSFANCISYRCAEIPVFITLKCIKVNAQPISKFITYVNVIHNRISLYA